MSSFSNLHQQQQQQVATAKSIFASAVEKPVKTNWQ